MTPLRWGMLILLLAIAAEVMAFRLLFEPCFFGGTILLVGLIGACVFVTIDARRRLDANRATLMRAAQMCPACGYTIRAATDRCPECGVPTQP